jgi:hypothetical protein
MRNTIAMLALGCLLCLAGHSFAQTVDEKALAARMETLKGQLVNPDSTTLANLTDDALSYGHSTGVIEDKPAFIADLLAGKTVLANVEFSAVTIKIAGNTAIVRNRLTGETVHNGVHTKIDIIVLHVWKKEKGVWKLLARQAAKIPPPAAN